jgi:hypothetical protein
MAEAVGVFPKAEVLEALARPLAPRSESLTPEDVWVDGNRLLMRIRVDQVVEDEPATQTWSVAFDVGDRDLALTHLDTLRIIFRALIEEWWDTLQWGEKWSVEHSERLV